jgi:hypothetical protein
MSTPLRYFIDFDADGDYQDVGEDVSERVDGKIGSSWLRGKYQIQKFAPAAAGQATFVLSNIDRDYSPGNASSPLYGLVLPGRKVQIETTGTAGEDFEFLDGTDFEFLDGSDFEFLGTPGRIIWSGLLDGIQQNPDEDNPTVSFSCLGNLNKLRGKTGSTGVYFSITTSEALGHLLDAVGWPALDRDIQTGLTILSVWWLDKTQDAFDAAEQLRATEGPWASIYEDAEGKFVFENRDARTAQVRSTSSQATFSGSVNITGTQGNPGRVTYDPNFKDTIEAATITIDERATQGQTVIWELGQELTIGPNLTRRFNVRSTSGDPFINAVLPSPVASDTVQTATADVPLTAGTFKVRFREETSAGTLDWDSTAAEWETALEGLSTIGSGNILCAGGPISTTPISCTLIGIFAGINVLDQIEIVEAVLNPVSAPATVEAFTIQDGDTILTEKQGLRSSGPLTAGSYLLEFDSAPTGTINYNDNAAAVDAALSGLYSGVIVAGGPLSSGIPFSMNLLVSTNEPQAEVVVLTPITALVGTTSISVAITTQGGVPDYVVTAGTVGFSFSRTSGAVVQLNVGAGPTGCTLAPGLRVRANVVSVINSHEVSFPDDTTDIPAGKIFQPNIRREISLDFAQEYVEMVVEHYSISRPTVILQIVTSLYSPDNELLYERRVSDRITIIEEQTGLSEDYHIEQIGQAVTSDLLLVTVFGCEQTKAASGPPLFWY